VYYFRRNERASPFRTFHKLGCEPTTGSRHEAALVPAPKGLAALLDLVNLLPSYLRRPYWARRELDKPERSTFMLLEETVLTWRFGEESRLAHVAAELGEAVPQEGLINTPSLLWVTLCSALRELPLALQAFVLHDEQGNEVEVDGDLVPVGIPPDLQSWRNLSVIRKSQHELDRIIEQASKRIAKSIEEDRSDQRLCLVHPSSLGSSKASKLRESGNVLFASSSSAPVGKTCAAVPLDVPAREGCANTVRGTM
jgi:hypothetical protein